MFPKIITFKDQALFQFNSLDVFNIIIDIESYPEFLPWCHEIKVISRDESSVITDSIIKFKAITVEYRSKISFCPPYKNNIGYISITSHEGAFTNLVSSWQFITKGDKKTLVKFDIECEFRSKLIHYSMSLIYRRAQEKLITAFKNRIYFLLKKH